MKIVSKIVTCMVVLLSFIVTLIFHNSLMRMLPKIIVCIMVVLLSYIVTLIFHQSLIGWRHAPWTNFYLFEMVLIWGLTLLVLAVVLIPTVSDVVGVSIGNWIRGGGFWAIWSKNNTPSNTWVVVALILLFNALTYGPPTPQVDWDEIQEVITRPLDTVDYTGAAGRIKSLARGFLGQDLAQPITHHSQESPLLVPRYQKGWWRILLALLAIIFASLVWIWGRRDELHQKFADFAEYFKSKRESSGFASTPTIVGSVTGSALMGALVKQTSEGRQIANHFISESIVKIAENGLKWLSSLMKKY